MIYHGGLSHPLFAPYSLYSRNPLIPPPARSHDTWGVRHGVAQRRGCLVVLIDVIDIDIRPERRGLRPW